MAGREGDSLERSSLHKAAELTDGFGKVHHRPYLQEEEEVGKEDEEDERCVAPFLTPVTVPSGEGRKV